MNNVYEVCPIFENEHYLLRQSALTDAKDLLEVYSDKNALPFFNSDNCHGDNFYYPDMPSMEKAIEFWCSSYESRWFVRWTIIDKVSDKGIGTIELFHREAKDDLNHVGLLRLDMGSAYERADVILDVMKLIVPPTYDMFECEEIITKIPLYAVERMKAASEMGFEKTEKLLVGTMDGYAYKDYWIMRKYNGGIIQINRQNVCKKK